MKGKEVFAGLWICPGDEVKQACRDMRENKDTVFLSPGLFGVLNVADDYPEYPIPREVMYVHTGLNDGPPDHSAPFGGPNEPMAYANAVMALDALLYLKPKVAVHCHGGVSRACTVLILYLAWRENDWDVDYWIDAVKSRYDRCNPHPKHLIRGDGLKCRSILDDMGYVCLSKGRILF